MKIIKAIWSEIVWFMFGLLICAAALALLVLMAWGLYLLVQTPWLFDGTNPRYGG